MAQTKIKRKQFSDDGWIPANETWMYASADDPTYTFTISAFDATAKYSVGMKVKLTQSTGGTKFAIITKVVFDDPGSTITCYFGTDYNLENEAVTAPYYSMLKAPFGFPLDPTKWTQILSDTTQRSQASAVANTWYNLGSLSISIPIGVWEVSYKVTSQSIQYGSLRTSLSTANNSESDMQFTVRPYIALASGMGTFAYMSKNLALTSKTAYYLIITTDSTNSPTIYFRNDVSAFAIRAVCAYL